MFVYLPPILQAVNVRLAYIYIEEMGMTVEFGICSWSFVGREIHAMFDNCEICVMLDSCQ